MTDNPASLATGKSRGTDLLQRVWTLPLFALAFNLAGIWALGAVEVELRMAGRVPFPVGTRAVLLYGLLTVLTSVWSAVATRQGTPGPGALLSALTVPLVILAAFTSLYWALLLVWCCSAAVLLLISIFLALALFVCSAGLSVIAALADLEILRRKTRASAGPDDE